MQNYNNDLLYIQLIDNQLLIISQNATSAENQEQVTKISEMLIQLINNVTMHISDNVEVNGRVLLIQGLILKLQFQQLTKPKYNQEFQLQNDYLDNLIAYIQKQQLIVNYNYYNLSEIYTTMLQIYLNRSDFEIDQNHLVKTILTNSLYTNNQINQLELNTYYRIDLAEFRYCQSSQETSIIFEYNYYCINHLTANKFEKCDLEMEEIDNQKTQLFCKCKAIGNLFLIKIANKTMTQQNNTSVNQTQFDLKQMKLLKQPYLFVQVVFIMSSFIVYCFLFYKENQRDKEIAKEQSQSGTQDTLEKGQKVFGRKYYPGHVFIFKASFKYIHSILQFFQVDENKVNKSFRFLQFSNQISVLILTSIWEVLVPNFVIINASINLLVLLGFRAISKIFQTIYLFKGKISIAVVLLYFCLPFMYVFLTIFLFNQNEINQTGIDVQITLNLLSTLFLVFFIYEPIAIYLRIVIYKTFMESVKNNEYIPINHFVYFFIYHSKINNIYDQLNIR